MPQLSLGNGGEVDFIQAPKTIKAKYFIVNKGFMMYN